MSDTFDKANFTDMLWDAGANPAIGHYPAVQEIAEELLRLARMGGRLGIVKLLYPDVDELLLDIARNTSGPRRPSARSFLGGGA